jgi:hypothetical protein
MKLILLCGLALAALAVLATVVLAAARPYDPLQAWAASERTRRQIEQEAHAAARAQAFWDVAVPVGGALAGLAVLAAGAIAVDAYLQRRRPLVMIGPAPVSRYRVIDGRALALQQAAIAGHYTAAATRPGPHSLHYAPHTVYQNRSEGGPLADAPAPALAAPAPTFATLLAQGIIGPGRPLITGYSDGQPLTAALADWRSGAVAGLPGSGKTTTQRFIAAQAALQGARLVVLDPHMHKGADSLAGTLAPLAATFLCDPAEHPRDMLQALHLVNEIMQGRLAGGPVEFPLFVFCDEFTALMARSDLAAPLATLIEAIAQEGRASLIQGVISGQIWTADRAGGSALRDSLASTYVHRMKPGQARVLLPAEDARRAATLPTGAAVLWRADGSIADVVIPLTTAADMAAVGRLLPSGAAVPVLSASRPAAVPAPAPGERRGALAVPADGMDGTPAPVADAYTARAVALFLAGQDLREVVATLHPEIDVKSGGRPYRDKRAAVESLIRNELARLRAGQ